MAIQVQNRRLGVLKYCKEKPLSRNWDPLHLPKWLSEEIDEKKSNLANQSSRSKRFIAYSISALRQLDIEGKDFKDTNIAKIHGVVVVVEAHPRTQKSVQSMGGLKTKQCL